jgi:hypothetical protein
MDLVAATPLTTEQLREVDAWIGSHLAEVPESVAAFLQLHRRYLNAGKNLPQRFNEMVRELRRALGITCSSERRRSGSPVSAIPGAQYGRAKTEQERLEQQLDRSHRLGNWHKDLRKRHTRRAKCIVARLAKMKKKHLHPVSAQQDQGEPSSPTSLQDIIDETPLESIELTEEELAANRAETAAFVKRLQLGEQTDQALSSTTETLMPGGVAVTDEDVEYLAAAMLTEDLADAKVIKTLNDQRVRYNVAVSVKPITLNVEKHVVVKSNGERTVVSASTDAYGPARYSVTWLTLATLAVLVGQFALPLNRIATLFSTAGKQFSAGGLSRMLNYVAQRLAPIYLKLSAELADSDILSGDDTSCRVLEVTSYLKKANPLRGKKPTPEPRPPWDAYRSPTAAETSIQQCRQRQEQRQHLQADGARDIKRTKGEEPSLGMLIGRALEFESPRQDGTGNKQSLNTTVLTGRSVADDPRSLIVFYRSHLGGLGNLLESILHRRSSTARDVIVQSDLSTTNLVKDEKLLSRFNLKPIGCSAHARRPFAVYEQEDPVYCPFMLHLFTGIAMHEQLLDEHGRNRENVLAVRKVDSRELWEEIKELATTMQAKWSKGTKLGTAARYILNHYDKLTAYLDDPRLQPTNNQQERMLRTEKLIEGSSMFRLSLEGRFVLDIIRTILQTAVAARIPVHDYLVDVLRADPDEIEKHPERFTPHAWDTKRLIEQQHSEA